MVVIGCDYHPGFQQIAFVDSETGELGERRLVHCEEAEQFYGKLKEPSMQVRVGMEASGHARWFEHLLHDLQFELWIGAAAEIRTKRVAQTKDGPSGSAAFVAADAGRPVSEDLGARCSQSGLATAAVASTWCRCAPE
jgi:hypothetical protein